MISVKKYFPSAGRWTWLLALTLVLFPAGCINDPVDEDFFNDPSKVMGGFYKPCAPHLDTVSMDSCTINLNFSDPFESNPAGQTCTDEIYDNLYYLVYVTTVDPSSFDPEDFNSSDYYVGYITSVEQISFLNFLPDTYYFWMIIWDGRFESDHSDILSVTVPDGCP